MSIRVWVLLIVLSLTLSVGIPLFIGGLDALSAFRNLSWSAFLLLPGLTALSWLVQAGRLLWLSQAIGLRLNFAPAFGTTMAAEFGHAASPGGTGGPATYLFLLTRYGLSGDQALAVQTVDQAVDAVFFAAAIPLAMILYALDAGSLELFGFALLVILLLLCGLWLLIWLLPHYRRVLMFFGRTMNRLPRLHRFRYRAARFIVRFRHSVVVLAGMGLSRLLGLYFLSAAYWLLRYSVLPILFLFLGLDADFWTLFLVQLLVLALGQVTFLPGGGGGVELGYTAIMRQMLPQGIAASTLLMWRFATFYFTLIVCGPVFVYLTGRHARELISRRTSAV